MQIGWLVHLTRLKFSQKITMLLIANIKLVLIYIRLQIITINPTTKLAIQHCC